MSSGDCQSGDTLGFPIKLGSSLGGIWPGTDPAIKEIKLKKMTIPTDFSIAWASEAIITMSVIQDATKFQITGFDAIATQTTLTYGVAIYSCSSVISIVRNQHPTLYDLGQSTYEIILAFQIQNPSANPSSPHVILMCRPLVFSNSSSLPFLDDVNEAALTKQTKQTRLNLSRLFAYNQNTLMPMVTYQTCLSTKFSTSIKSIKVRVHLVKSPLYVKADTNGVGTCSSVSKYILTTTPKHIKDLVGSSFAQFKNGSSTGGFPTGTSDNLTPMESADIIKEFDTVANKLIILVPDELLGKSLAELSKNVLPKPTTKKKAFKCYRINPEKDIVDNQILVDPQTGQSLADTMAQEALESTGGDLSLANLKGPKTPSGLMPGDIQEILVIIIISIVTIVLIAHLGYIGHLFIQKKDSSKGSTEIFKFVCELVILIIFSAVYAPPVKDTPRPPRPPRREINIPPAPTPLASDDSRVSPNKSKSMFGRSTKDDDSKPTDSNTTASKSKSMFSSWGGSDTSTKGDVSKPTDSEKDKSSFLNF
jgi:hypothetical protein